MVDAECRNRDWEHIGAKHMRVLMFCPQFAPVVGGAERQAEKLGRALSRCGVQVRVLTPRLDTGSPTDEVVEGLPVHRFELSDLSKRFPLPGIGLINAPWIAVQVVWQVWREARDVDVVHCHIGSLQTVAAAWAARLRGIPVLCKAAVADDCSDLGEAAKAGLAGRVVARVGRRAFTRWVATTQAVRSALVRAGVDARRIVVIPNGVDLPESPTHPQVARPVRRFLYLGRLSTNTQRDVPGLIQAFDGLADSFADVELAVVGGGDLLVETRALAAGCRNADRIQVPGQGGAAHWLAWADCFVLPSRREGLSNGLLEAMAAGLPCIANDIPPNREVLVGGEAGLLVPVGDADGMEAAMLRLVADAQCATCMATKAWERAQKLYAIESVTRSYQSLYAELIAMKSSGKESIP